MPTLDPSTASVEAIRARILELHAQRRRREAKVYAERDRARTEFPAFCEYVYRDERNSDRIVLDQLHRTWITHIQRCWDLGLNAAVLAPYGSGKTTHLAVNVPLFTLGVNPNLRVKLFSTSDDIARERLSLVRRYIEDSHELREVFPHLRPSTTQDWTKGKLYIQRPTRAKDASLEAKGILSRATGGRADLIIFDDCNDQRNTIQQPRDREKVWDNFLTYMGRLEPGGRVALIATRYHTKDIPGSILADEVMRQSWGFLVQRVTDDFQAIDCEYFYGRDEPASDTEPAVCTLFANAA